MIARLRAAPAAQPPGRPVDIVGADPARITSRRFAVVGFPPVTGPSPVRVRHCTTPRRGAPMPHPAAKSGSAPPRRVRNRQTKRQGGRGRHFD